MTKEHTIDTLANALYEGHSSLENLAECMARQYGKADALSFFGCMDENVQFFWKDIARQIIEHSKEWKENEGSCCVLSEKESDRLRQMRLSLYAYAYPQFPKSIHGDEETFNNGEGW